MVRCRSCTGVDVGSSDRSTPCILNNVCLPSAVPDARARTGMPCPFGPVLPDRVCVRVTLQTQVGDPPTCTPSCALQPGGMFQRRNTVAPVILHRCADDQLARR
jgi:hypothetical protein